MNDMTDADDSAPDCACHHNITDHFDPDNDGPCTRCGCKDFKDTAPADELNQTPLQHN